MRIKCKVDTQDMVEAMEVETRNKEEMVEMAKRKKLAWRTTALCRSMILDLTIEAVTISEEKHCKTIVLDALEMAWTESETNSMVVAFLAMPRGVQFEVGRRIRKMLSQRESMDILEQQKARDRKRDLARIKKLEWENSALSRSLVMDIVDEAIKFPEVRECTEIVMEIIDQVVLETDAIEMMEHSGQEGREGSNIKYSPGTELELPQYMFQHLKPHCSKRASSKYSVKVMISQEQPRCPKLMLPKILSFENIF